MSTFNPTFQKAVEKAQTVKPDNFDAAIQEFLRNGGTIQECPPGDWHSGLNAPIRASMHSIPSIFVPDRAYAKPVRLTRAGYRGFE